MYQYEVEAAFTFMAVDDACQKYYAEDNKTY